MPGQQSQSCRTGRLRCKASDKTEKEKALIAAYLDTVTGKAEAEALGAEFKISLDCGVTFGKRYESPITSPHGPVELQDGTVLWVGTTFRKNEALGEDRIEAYTVHPDGSMEKIGQIPQVYENGKPLQFCEPHTVQLSDQTLICHIRVEPRFTTYQSKSTDGGRTWSLPRRILEDMGGAPVHLLEHSSGMLLGLYSYRKHPYGIRAMFSSDGGETWETGYTIYRNEISGDLGYPSTVEMEDGSLLTVFYAHPGEDAPAVILQQRWTF